MRIAILEDDLDQATLVQSWLNANGHNGIVFTDAVSFKRELKRESFDLAILDWELPKSSGIEVLCWLRENLEWQLPVIFTTMREGEGDLVEALGKGADDYLVKPLKQQELLARIGAVSRRLAPNNNQQDVYGDYEFDRERQILRYRQEPIIMSGKEFELAYFMFKNTGRLISRDHILEAVWGSSAPIQTRKVDTYISRIRAKLNQNNAGGYQIVSVYQRGYRLEQNAETSSKPKS